MSDRAVPPNPQELALLDAVIRNIARMRRLAPGDHQDFAQSVHLKLIQGNYGVFAKFRGDSSLRTYLSVVVSRALLDWRNARYGKWRPSAAAARLGPEAVALELIDVARRSDIGRGDRNRPPVQRAGVRTIARPYRAVAESDHVRPT